MKYKNLADRILSNTVKIDDCWCWSLACGPKGYGRITVRVAGKPYGFWVHRVAYELFTGNRIPDGMTLDHKWPQCRHKNCWRPDHMEVVSLSENTQRQHRKRRGEIPTPIYREDFDARIRELLQRFPIHGDSTLNAQAP